MDTKDLEQFIAHLQFLGYEVDQKEDSLRASHAMKMNLWVRPLAGGILFFSIYSLSESALTNRLELLEFINNLNQNATVSRFCLGSENDFHMEAWYPDFYTKVNFGEFLNAHEFDCSLLGKFEAGKFLS